MTGRGAPPRRLIVPRRDPAPLVEAIDARSRAGSGWINLVPDLGAEAETAARAGGGGGWFSARGPAVPQATWVAGRLTRRNRVVPARLGLEHGRGPRAVAQLETAGHALPAGWRVRQDHPRRGLVVELPPATPPALIAEWLLAAAAALSEVPTGDTWLAEVWSG